VWHFLGIVSNGYVARQMCSMPSLCVKTRRAGWCSWGPDTDPLALCSGRVLAYCAASRMRGGLLPTHYSHYENVLAVHQNQKSGVFRVFQIVRILCVTPPPPTAHQHLFVGLENFAPQKSGGPRGTCEGTRGMCFG